MRYIAKQNGRWNFLDEEIAESLDAGGYPLSMYIDVCVVISLDVFRKKQQELLEKEKTIEKRDKTIVGLRDAIKKRDERIAGIRGKEIQTDPALVFCEYRKTQNGWIKIESYTLPVESDVRFSDFAIDYVKNNFENLESLRKIFFNEKHGWIVNFEEEVKKI